MRDGVVHAELTRRGVIAELGPPTVGVVVRGRLIRCARPAEADFSAFAVGAEAELHCHFEGDHLRLARLKNSLGLGLVVSVLLLPCGRLVGRGPSSRA